MKDIRRLRDISPEELENIIRFARSLREGNKISFEKISKEILDKFQVKVSKQTVMRWLSGKTNPFRKIRIVEIRSSPELSYVIGAFLGDGTLKFDEKYYKYYVILRVKDKEFAEEFKKNLEKIGYKVMLRYDRDSTRVDRWSAEVRSKELYFFLSKDIDELSKYFLEYPTEFLRGIFDAEGFVSVSVSNNKFHWILGIGVYNKKIIDYVAKALRMIGIKGKIRKIYGKGRKIPIRGKIYTAKEDLLGVFISDISNLRKFYEKVGFTIKRKMQKLRDILEIVERYGYSEKAVKRWLELYEKNESNRWVRKSTLNSSKEKERKQ